MLPLLHLLCCCAKVVDATNAAAVLMSLFDHTLHAAAGSTSGNVAGLPHNM
jgi:hypothetical protein